MTPCAFLCAGMQGVCQQYAPWLKPNTHCIQWEQQGNTQSVSVPSEPLAGSWHVLVFHKSCMHETAALYCAQQQCIISHLASVKLLHCGHSNISADMHPYFHSSPVTISCTGHTNTLFEGPSSRGPLPPHTAPLHYCCWLAARTSQSHYLLLSCRLHPTDPWDCNAAGIPPPHPHTDISMHVPMYSLCRRTPPLHCCSHSVLTFRTAVLLYCCLYPTDPQDGSAQRSQWHGWGDVTLLKQDGYEGTQQQQQQDKAGMGL